MRIHRDGYCFVIVSTARFLNNRYKNGFFFSLFLFFLSSSHDLISKNLILFPPFLKQWCVCVCLLKIYTSRLFFSPASAVSAPPHPAVASRVRVSGREVISGVYFF